MSDCLANGVPVIYTERGPFPEYPILVEAITERLPSVFLDSRSFQTGDWAPAMAKIRPGRVAARTVRSDGADVCVEKLSRFFQVPERKSAG